MSDQLDNRPVFTILMGCNGAGKSAWKRLNYDRLPERFIEQDAVAGGFGDWNNEENRKRTRVKVDAEIEECFTQRLDWGIESTFSGLPGPQMMDRAIDQGYRVEGIYIGTNDPSINIKRIEYRVTVGTGHEVDADRIAPRYSYSLSNLRKYFDRFDQLELFDNSEEDDLLYMPQLALQCIVLEKKIELRVEQDQLAPWCGNLITRIEQARSTREMQLRREQEKRQRRTRKG